MRRKEDTQRELPITEAQTEDRLQRLTDLIPDEFGARSRWFRIEHHEVVRQGL